jgi:hypothetical protein
VIVLKDKANKESHADSAQVACEAAGSIRTVAALTGEEYCLERYSNSLLRPLREAKRAAVRSSLLYALSQTTVYWVLVLIFWYGKAGGHDVPILRHAHGGDFWEHEHWVRATSPKTYHFFFILRLNNCWVT